MSYRPLRPAHREVALELFTLRDAIDHCLFAYDSDGSGSTQRKIRAAVLEAYRAFPSEHQWKYLERVAVIHTSSSQSEGTIEYDSSTRQLTLTGSTWPADARFMTVVVDSKIAKIASRDSDTVVTLAEDVAFSSDIASGTSYEVFRSEYPLPIDYLSGEELRAMNDGPCPSFVLPGAISQLARNYSSPQISPIHYTVRSTADYMGGMCVEFSPPPSTQKSYYFSYSAAPRPVTLFPDVEYSSGVVSSSGTTVTGVGTAFTDQMVGCVFRSSHDSSTVPTGLSGGMKDDNPYKEQRVIASVESATSLTLDVAFSDDIPEESKYSIGSPIDLSHESMLTAFLFLCEANYARMLLRKDYQEKFGAYVNELIRAKTFDNRRRSISTVTVPAARSLEDISRRGGL